MNSGTRSGAGLFLMELLLGILIFSLAAAACVRIFATSSVNARHSEEYLNAIAITQNVAEGLRSGAGEPPATRYNADGQAAADGAFTLSLQTERADDGLTDAVATVSNEAGQTLFSLAFTYLEAGA